jgi:thiamine kinase-like enzyme
MATGFKDKDGKFRPTGNSSNSISSNSVSNNNTFTSNDKKKEAIVKVIEKSVEIAQKLEWKHCPDCNQPLDFDKAVEMLVDLQMTIEKSFPKEYKDEEEYVESLRDN